MKKFQNLTNFYPTVIFSKRLILHHVNWTIFVTISKSKISMIALMQDIRFRQLKPLKCETQRKSRGFWIYTILYATYITTYEQKAK